LLAVCVKHQQDNPLPYGVNVRKQDVQQHAITIKADFSKKFMF